MDEKKSQVIALATVLFILAIVLLNFIFSQAKPPQSSSLPLKEELPAVASPATSPETLPENGAVPVISALPTDSEIQATLAEWHQKKQILERKKAEKAKKAENVMAIVRGNKLAPPDPWKRDENPDGSTEIKSEEKPDSISEQELDEGVKSGRYFYAH